MFIHKNKFNFIIAIAFLSSCSSMNVTEERVYSGDVKTVQALSSADDNIRYDSKAVFASATIYFEFDKSTLTSKSIQTLKSAVNALVKDTPMYTAMNTITYTATYNIMSTFTHIATHAADTL